MKASQNNLTWAIPHDSALLSDVINLSLFAEIYGDKLRIGRGQIRNPRVTKRQRSKAI